MANVVESLLESKLIQLQELQREIDALRVAAKLVKQAESPAPAGKSVPGVHPTPSIPSRIEKNRERTEKVIALLNEANGREMHVTTLGKAFGVSKEAMREWLMLRLQKYGDRCPWVVGSHSYSFKRRMTIDPTFTGD